MNQTEAESVKDLAKPTVEAIKILHRAKQEAENEELQYPLNINEWKWEPEPGEWVCDEVGLIYMYVSIARAIDNMPTGRLLHLSGDQSDYVLEGLIPILPWETIERVLEGVEYRPVVQAKWVGGDCYCHIWKDDDLVGEVISASTRQEAVMRSVIQLGREIKNA